MKENIFNKYFVRINFNLTISGVTDETFEQVKRFAMSHPDRDENGGFAHVSKALNDTVIPVTQILH